MAIKATLTPDEAFRQIKENLRALKSFAVAQQTRIAGGTNADVLRSMADQLRAKRGTLATLAGTPGIAQWAKDQFDDQTYDIAAEWAATMATVDAAITTLVNGLNSVTMISMNANGSHTWASFTAGQLAPLDADLGDIDASIEV